MQILVHGLWKIRAFFEQKMNYETNGISWKIEIVQHILKIQYISLLRKYKGCPKSNAPHFFLATYLF
jgi:hypothetical protein